MKNNNTIDCGRDAGDEHQKSALEKHDEAQAARAATGTLKYNHGLFAKRFYDKKNETAQKPGLRAKL